MTAAASAPEVPGGMGRASAILAAGTIVSRVLGFARGVILALAIGQVASASANAFGVANQLPNNVYALVAGGLLSAVLVPQIVKAAAHADGGENYINRVVTLGIVIFAVVTIAATLAAPALIALYTYPVASGDRGFSGATIQLAVAFAYWCLPQIFFYALYSLLSEVLNARRIFGPFTWAPVFNNVVSVGGILLFMALFGGAESNRNVDGWSAGRIALLGGTATVSVAAQALILLLFWRRAGLSFRPDFRWRGVGLGATGKAAGWLFGMVLVTQIAGVVQTQVSTLASTTGVATLQNSWLIFMLPFSVVSVSITTAYFTRMSANAARGDLTEVRADLSASLRSIGVLIVFAAVALSVVAFPFARVYESRFANVQAMSWVILAFLPGLILYSVLFVIQRVFYSLGDTRTPFLIQCLQSILFIVGALLTATLPTDQIGISIAAVTTIAGTVQAIVSIVVVRRRLGGVDGRLVLVRHLQYLGCALLSGSAGLFVVALLGGFSPRGFAQSGIPGALVSIVVAGGVMAAIYFSLLALFRNPELAAVTGAVTARFSRSR